MSSGFAALKPVIWILATLSVFAVGVAGVRPHGQVTAQAEQPSSLYGDVDHVHLLPIEETRPMQESAAIYSSYDIVETTSISPQGFLEPLVITDKGDLAGIMAENQSGDATPFLKLEGGPVLGVPVDGGSVGSRVFGLNEKGVAVGQFSKEPGGPMISYVVDQDSGATVLDYRARAINKSGWIAGSRTVDGKPKAILVKDNETISLPPIGGLPQCVASSINDQGTVVGTSQGNFNSNDDTSKELALPTMWDAAGTASQLPMPPFIKNVRALEINNKETVALLGWVNENKTKIFLLDTKKNELREIPRLNDQLNIISHLNDRNEMVGYTQNRETDEMHGWLYKDGRTVDLVDLIPKDSPIIPEAAMWINNKGQIVGLAEKQGKYVGFMMTPTSQAHISK